MTLVPQAKRHEYWNHFIERWYLESLGGNLRINSTKLKHIKPMIFEDDVFWMAVIIHHQGHAHAPEELAQEDQLNYTSCRDTFWRLLLDALFRHNLLP